MSQRPIVLLTNPIDPVAEQRLAERSEVRRASAVDADTLRRESASADGLIVRAPLPDDIFAGATRLRAVVRHGAGVDMIPIDRATEAGVPVANCPGVNAVTVAQFAIMQMLNLARRLPKITARLKSGEWHEARALADEAEDLTGKCVGIVGMGAIGTEIARIARDGLQMRVLGHRRRLAEIGPEAEPAALDVLLSQSDFVVLACPLTDETRGLIDAQRLSSMKASAFLVNVSRGAVVDQRALTASLRERRIAGAALDVFETQPLPLGSELLALDSVIATPHLAGITKQSMRRMSELAVDQILQMLDGQPPSHLVNPEVLPAASERRARLLRLSN
ncbi:MAG: hydroxyacid dehydrogenase [Limnobacter sp.]|nr:hydroxyacid dehydrogenase [Limnobacter sp.]